MKQVKTKYVHSSSTEKTLSQEEMVLFPFVFYYFPQYIPVSQKYIQYKTEISVQKSEMKPCQESQSLPMGKI